MLPSPRTQHSTRPSLSSLHLTSPPSKSVFPLTPPLTPASTRPDFRPSSFDTSAFNLHLRDHRSWTSPSADSITISEAPLLPSPTSPAHPKIALEPDLETQPATRFLSVHGVPSTANSHSLKQAFVACGDLKGIYVRFQAEHGAIILAFFDVRHTIRAHRQINTRILFDNNVRLASHFISADDLRQLIGQSNFVNSNDGDLFISTSRVGPKHEIDLTALQNVLASFGDLRFFGIMDTHARAFHVEYYDARDATSALATLNGRVILGVRLHLALRDASGSGPASDSPPTLSPAAFPLHTTAPALPNSIPFPPSPSPTPHLLPLPLRRARHASLSLSPSRLRHQRRSSNVYMFDAVGKPAAPPGTPPRPRSISVSSEAESPVAGRLALPVSSAAPAPLASSSQWPAQETPVGLGLNLGLDLARPRKPYPPVHFFMPPLHVSVPVPAPAPVPQERNKIDIASIEQGGDTRTTVMIKNIPNKMRDRHLIEFINDVCPRKIDFLYLRMDFTNGCNFGYAFVNFISVEDLLCFAREKLDTKWNRFSSEKILGMSYANSQGKEALIHRFRSSSIMDQRESWRPKLFFSSGPNQGFPEDFPGPVYIRRNERERVWYGQGKELFRHLNG